MRPIFKNCKDGIGDGGSNGIHGGGCPTDTVLIGTGVEGTALIGTGGDQVVITPAYA